MSDVVQEATRKALAKKHEMLQETLIRAVGEGWQKFYFWIDRIDYIRGTATGNYAITMHCGPVKPDGAECEEYDVAEIEAKIDRLRAP